MEPAGPRRSRTSRAAGTVPTRRRSGRIFRLADASTLCRIRPRGRAWSDHELERWTELWSSPIAEAWDEQMSGLVAAYVIAVSVTLTGRIYAQLVGEKRQLANDLLLTPGAMARAHYRIGEPTTDGRMAAVHSLRVGA